MTSNIRSTEAPSPPPSPGVPGEGGALSVFHVISGIDPRAGGTTTALQALAIAQQRVGLSVTVAAPRTAGLRADAVDELRANGVGVELINPGRRRWISGFLFRRALRPLVRAADVVHIHACWEEIQHQAATLARRSGKPYLFTPHGMLDPWSLRQSALKKKIYLALRLRKDLNRASAIHYADDVERDLTRPLGLTSPAIVEPHVVNFEEFQKLPSPGSFRSRHPLLNHRPIVLFMSRVHPKKGLDLLIPAFAAQRSDAVLVIAGPVEANYHRELLVLAAKHGVADRVMFTGMLYGEDRVAALVDATVFALPSYQENFGIVIVESLAAGTPVVISDQVNIHRQITAANVGRVVPTTIDALTAALHEMLDQPELRAAAAGRAMAFARQTFDAARTAEHWKQHYAALIPMRGSVPA